MTPQIHSWIKTPCGRAKYNVLIENTSLAGRLRLGWFICIAVLKDWNIPNPDQSEGLES